MGVGGGWGVNAAFDELSNGDKLIEWWYTYRIVIHLSNSDTLIE